MNAHNDDDIRIGVPTAGRKATAPAGATASARLDPMLNGTEYRGASSLADPMVELRPGETELGRPPQVPIDLAPLTPEELAQLKLLDEEQAARELAEAELLLASDPTRLGWLGWFGSPLAFAFLLGMAGVFGIFLFNQAVSLLNALAAQPQWAQYVGYAGLGVFGCCVLYAFLRFLLLYLRLRENRQLRVRGVEELSRRTRLRWLATAKSAEARGQIETYLNSFPMSTEKERKSLHSLGLTDELQTRLATVRVELLDHDRFASTEQWFAHFRDGFQSQLDIAAESRVKYWASRIWVVTAVAPNAMIDSGATLFYTFSMLSDLCQIYNLRAGRTGTAVLLGRVFFNAYLAGQGTEWEKLAEDQYDQLFHEAMKVVGVGVSSNVIGKMLGKVGAKATTGYLNRILLIRLGRYASRLLRPVTKD
jgi:putative membrane protein